jgi:hypothetical protein
MLIAGSPVDHRLALGVEGHRADVRPAKRAIEQRPEHVQQWLLVDYPALVKKAYGVTSFGAMSLQVWPSLANSRDQWCAPEHDSIATLHGGSVATASISLARGTAGRLSATRPLSSCLSRAKTFLARSIPSKTMDMDFSFRVT